MSDSEFDKSTKGYFTVRHNKTFFSGTWTDILIEQTANREFKVQGGVVHRGFTEEILNSYITTKSAFSDICQELENFCSTTFFTSEQHVELRETRIARNDSDVNKLYDWLINHNPFSKTQIITSLGTGIIGNDAINCHKSKEIGENDMKKLSGKLYKDIVIKRENRVHPLSTIN